jgi:hypothetical protein
MDHPLLYRKRIIPDECILLKDDQVLFWDEQRIITRWNALKPKKNLHHGYSCYFLSEGFKVSKFYRADNSLLYYYCDIITHEYSEDRSSLIVTDLLADVIVYPDGFVKVVDLDEMVPALECGGITINCLKQALLSCSRLLSLIYAGRLSELTKYIDQFEG